MKPFCEVVVAKILPAMRAIVTKELIETYGMTQAEVAKRLGMTQPAISQYSRQLRGSNVRILKSNRTIMGQIKELAGDIASGVTGSREIPNKICVICRSIRRERMICRLHEENYPTIKPCQQCFEFDVEKQA